VAHILVIDDEESIRYSFHRFLTTEGHTVVTADCYLVALSRMDEEYFDLIIADINLDDGWGIDILHEVTRKKLTTRVIIMTAYPTNQTIKLSFSLQANNYLIKPLRQKSLIYSVDKALEKIVENIS
jgi:two-component system, NtrC family, response regulator HydG